MERFVSILIEHVAGNFPLWLAPLQAKVIPVSDDFLDYADSCADELMKRGFRVEVDRRGEKVGAKIRYAVTLKISYMLIIGEHEEHNQNVSVRIYTFRDIGSVPFSAFILILEEELVSNEYSAE